MHYICFETLKHKLLNDVEFVDHYLVDMRDLWKAEETIEGPINADVFLTALLLPSC